MRNSLLALIVIATMVGPGSALAEEGSGPNFTGTWVLNQDLSDSFQPQRLPAGSPQGGMRGGGGRGGGGGMRGGGGRGGGTKQNRTGQQPPPGDPQKVVRIQQEISRLEIFHAGPELNITSGLDISRLFFTDGRTTTVMAERGQATATATWRDATLKIQW